MIGLACLVFVVALAQPAAAQVNGYASFLVDTLPDPDARPGRQTVTELRLRVFAERRDQFGEHLRLVLSGHVDGLVGRNVPDAPSSRDAVVRPLDLYAELVWARAEVRLGASRIVWGRLDEFQPTDVVNPIDLSKFLLEGRSEARLAVGVVRGRFFLPRSATLEVIGVPGFRAGRFDQLDEPTSPFNLGVAPPTLVERHEPAFGLASLQGGARLTATTGRVDWGATAYRGLRTFPIVTARYLPLELPAAPPLFDETFPRFTMVGGDFETVRGAWGLRGEAAWFVDDTLQAAAFPRGVKGTSLEAGIGADRRAGDYRLAANVMVSSRSVDDGGRPLPGGDRRALDGTDLTLVVAADRSFARETRTLRVFGVYDPVNDTTFVRAIGAVSLRDDVWLEASGGLLAGSASTTFGRLSRRDFVYAKLKVFF
ncbi:MAG TPA: hypothetical protein VIY56_08755 [Vicinamibacterales bacterium]